MNPRSLGFQRSGGWRAVEKRQLAEHPECAACGQTHGNQVHHVKPFHTHPALELAVENLITLCKRHHLVFGHADCWKGINPHVREDCRIHRERVKRRMNS
jgi:hypothetical protein